VKAEDCKNSGRGIFVQAEPCAPNSAKALKRSRQMQKADNSRPGKKWKEWLHHGSHFQKSEAFFCTKMAFPLVAATNSATKKCVAEMTHTVLSHCKKGIVNAMVHLMHAVATSKGRLMKP